MKLVEQSDVGERADGEDDNVACMLKKIEWNCEVFSFKLQQASVQPSQSIRLLLKLHFSSAPNPLTVSL